MNARDRHAFDAPLTIAALLEREGLGGRRVAVEVNGEIVPRGVPADFVEGGAFGARIGMKASRCWRWT